MADENLTKEEVSEITGEDLENIQDAEHPERNPLDKKESGAPDLDASEWDNEIEVEDKEDFKNADIDFDEITSSDRDLYLNMVSLRSAKKEGTHSQDFKSRVDKVIKECNGLKEELGDSSRSKFLNIVLKKLEDGE